MRRRSWLGRLGRFSLASAGLLVAWAAVLFVGEWAWSSHVLSEERARVEGELRRIRGERVERPILFGPEEDGNAWDLIAEAATAAKNEWKLPVWSALFLDSKDRLKSMPAEERDRVIDSVKPQLETLKRALRRRWIEPDRWTEERLATESYFIGENRLIGVSAGACIHFLEQRRYQEATDLVLVLLGLGDRCKVKSAFWSDMNAAYGDRAAHRAIRRLLAEPSFPQVELLRIADALDSLGASPSENLLEGHRRRNVESGYRLLGLAEDRPGARDFIRDYNKHLMPGFRDAWSWRNQAARWIKAEEADREQIERAASLPIVLWIADLAPLNLEGVEPEMQRYWRLIEHAQAQLAFQLSRIALEVSRFGESRDRWPSDLGEVNNSLPLDPWTGRPFRLEIENDAAVIIAPELETRVCRALSTSQFKAEEWRKLTVVRRAR